MHHYTAAALLERVLSLKWCDVAGIFSHFARADEEDAAFTRLQLERFLECARFFEKRSLPPPLRHIANSAGALRFPEARLDMVRPGISLYGVAPAPGMAASMDALGLEPAMALATKVVYFAVCMDQMMVDLGPAGEAYNGDEAVLVGEQGGERITVGELAERAGTIPYEILTGLNARIPRRYVES